MVHLWGVQQSIGACCAKLIVILLTKKEALFMQKNKVFFKHITPPHICNGWAAVFVCCLWLALGGGQRVLGTGNDMQHSSNQQLYVGL